MFRYTSRELVLLTLVVVIDGLGATTSAAEPSGLSAFANKQLTRLPEGDREKLANSFKELTGDELGKFDDPDSIQPFLISKFSAGDAAWIFVEADQGWDVPGLSAMRVHVFDSHWKRLFKQSFPTGYRMFLADVTVERNPDLGCDVLVGKLVYSVRRKELLAAGRYVRAHFARQGGALELVRHEEADGTLSQQWYGVNPAFIIGPTPPQRTPEAWIGSLRSKEPVEQVAALVWVSGRHLPSTERRVEGISQDCPAHERQRGPLSR